MKTAEEPFPVSCVVHDGVEEDIQIVDGGAAIDELFYRSRSLMGDDDVYISVAVLQILYGACEVVVVGHRGSLFFALVFKGRQTSAEREDPAPVYDVNVAASETVDVLGDLVRLAAAVIDLLVLFYHVEVLVSAFDKEDVVLLLCKLFEILFFFLRAVPDEAEVARDDKGVVLFYLIEFALVEGFDLSVSVAGNKQQSIPSVSPWLFRQYCINPVCGAALIL